MSLRPALLLLLAAAVALPGQSPTAAHRALAERVLTTTPLIDGHNDLPWAIRNDPTARGDVDKYPLRDGAPGHTDLRRLRAGRVGGQFWSVYIPSTFGDSGFAKAQVEQILIAHRVIARHPEAFEFVTTADGVERAFRAGRIASLLGAEGGHVIENRLDYLRLFHALGVRYMTLTHSLSLQWADAGTDTAFHGGLTRFGREVVNEMNRLGMVVDLSHVSPGVMSAALDVSQAPVMFSHSSARAVTDVPRNVPDSILRRLRANGGVAMVTFVPGFVSQRLVDWGREQARQRAAARAAFPGDTAAAARAVAAWEQANPRPRATLADVADHLDHMKRVAGAAHVGIGGDFDGITEVVEGLEDVATYPALFAELARRGWTEAELRQLAGENILRVLRGVEATARRLQAAPPPSVLTLEEVDGPGAKGVGAGIRARP